MVALAPRSVQHVAAHKKSSALIAMAQAKRRYDIGNESEDFETLMNKARLEEAQAKAGKAREESKHERSK